MGKSHDELSRNLGKLDQDEVLKSVFALIKEVYGDVSKVTAPATSSAPAASPAPATTAPSHTP